MKTFYSSVFLLLVLLSSCTTQNLFRVDKNNTNDTAMVMERQAEHIIKPDDKITVSIWNHDDLSVGSLYGIYNSNEVYGKWLMVDKNGYVDLPEIGQTLLAGYTKMEAQRYLITLYSKYIIDPIIVVKVLNIEVTVLGEVMHPGNYTLDKENNTIVELLGKAGGLDFYANKKIIQVIRGKGEQAQTFTYDFTTMNGYQASNINLKAGDIIYVPTRKSKMIDKKAPVIVPFVSLVTGVVILLKFLQQ